MGEPTPTAPDNRPTMDLGQLEILKGMLGQTNDAVKLLMGQFAQHAEDTKKAVDGIAQTMVNNHSAVQTQLTDMNARIVGLEAWKTEQNMRADANSIRVNELQTELKKEQDAREALAVETKAQTAMLQTITKWTVDMSRQPLVQKIAKALGGLILLAIAAAAGYLGKGSK